jgi:hypothetical protein
MDIPKQRPANADDRRTASCRAIAIAGGVVVGVVVVLRYLGRWTLKKRMDIGKGKVESIFGMDDSEFIFIATTLRGCLMTCDSLQHTRSSDVLWALRRRDHSE